MSNSIKPNVHINSGFSLSGVGELAADMVLNENVGGGIKKFNFYDNSGFFPQRPHSTLLTNVNVGYRSYQMHEKENPSQKYNTQLFPVNLEAAYLLNSSDISAGPLLSVGLTPFRESLWHEVNFVFMAQNNLVTVSSGGSIYNGNNINGVKENGEIGGGLFLNIGIMIR